MKKILFKLLAVAVAITITGVFCVSAVGNNGIYLSDSNSNLDYKSNSPAIVTNENVGDGNYDENIISLEMTEGKDFKIIGVTDTHINSKESLDVFLTNIIVLISSHKPDLIVLTGDNIDNWGDHAQYLGYNANKDKVGHPDYGKVALDYSVAGRFKAWGVKWAVVMGNHDRDNAAGVKGSGTKLQNDFYMSLVEDGTYGCLYNQGVFYNTSNDGYFDQGGPQNATWYHKYGDYIINITDDGKAVYSVVLMDSGQHEAAGHLQNGFISAEQVEWYKEQMIKNSVARYGKFDLEAGLVVPSMVFIHQPIPEFAFAAAMATNPNGTGMVKPDYGFGYNGVASPARIQREDVNYGLFAAAKEVGGTDFFSGHNHLNNSTILYDGIRLNYLNRTGRRASEAGSWKPERINYAKMITIKADTYESEVAFALPKGVVTTEFLSDAMWK